MRVMYLESEYKTKLKSTFDQNLLNAITADFVHYGGTLVTDDQLSEIPRTSEIWPIIQGLDGRLRMVWDVTEYITRATGEFRHRKAAMTYKFIEYGGFIRYEDKNYFDLNSWFEKLITIA